MKKRTLPEARLPMLRMTMLHRAMLDKKYPNCRKMAEELEVSSKTIQRDIEYMRDVLALPIEYDALEHGFYYSGEVQEFPTVQISEGEMVALFIARHVLAQYEETPLVKSLRQAFAKITGQLTEHVDFQWEELSERIAFRRSNVSEDQIQWFETLSRSSMQGKKVLFDYRGIQDKAYKARTVCPYQLVCWNGDWYLVGWDEEREDWRVFSLKRIQNVQVQMESFERNADFNSELFWEESFGVYRGQLSERISIRFHGWAARLVTETTWHSSQKIQSTEAESVVITWNMQITPDVLRWVLSWGSHAEVLEPTSLKEKVYEEARGMVGD